MYQDVNDRALDQKPLRLKAERDHDDYADEEAFLLQEGPSHKIILLLLFWIYEAYSQNKY